MTVSPHVLGLPDSAGDPFLRNLNLVLQAVTTLNSSSAEPPVKERCMLWFDQSTAVLRMRNPSNTSWLPVLRVTDSGIDPLLRGDSITSIATLTTNVDGYIRALRNGTFRVEDVSSPDIPIFDVGKSGMVPGPSAAEVNVGGSLRADGAWRIGPTVLASRQFAGATDYALSNIPRQTAYRVAIRAKLSNGQPLVLQIGSGGSPSQSGYKCSVSRYYVDVDKGANSLASNQVRNGVPELLSSGFQVFRSFSSAQDMVIVGDLASSGNQWIWSGTGGSVDGGTDGDASRGAISLGGSLDYIRVISAGDPRGSYGDRASINSGFIAVY